MDQQKLKLLLQKIRDRDMGVTQAIEEFKILPFEDLDFVKIDHHRSIRKGLPEVVLAPGKSPEQLEQILAALYENSEPTLVTRLEPEVYEKLSLPGPDYNYNKLARVLNRNIPDKGSSPAKVVVVSAGTSDQQVALETRITLRAFDVEAKMIQDVGVAGIHRLFAHLPELRTADVIIVIAGMDGALASVVGGLIDAPIIAVPVSTGYGASFNGVSALLSMINSCASGLTVVNIDNGFGAAVAAGQIVRKLYS